MGLKVGIVGLPNVGKSTLFNALLGQARAEVSNYPFCTIKPNIGIVEVPNERLELLAQRLGLSRQIPATIQFVDVAGLVKGAHQGEGLGNQFLASLKECDVLVEVVRFFDDPQVAGLLNPEDDLKTIEIELILKDLEIAQRRLEKLKKEAPKEPALRDEVKVLEKICLQLQKGKAIRDLDLSEEEKKIITPECFLTLKPLILVANLSEKQLDQQDKLKENGFLPIGAKMEAELSELDAKEAQAYRASLGLKEKGLLSLIRLAYQKLDLVTFYTLKPEASQIQAWPLKAGSRAIEAAALIHSDFAKKFIKAEVIDSSLLAEVGSWAEAYKKGLVRTEGKDYVVQDKEVIYFKIGN